MQTTLSSKPIKTTFTIKLEGIDKLIGDLNRVIQVSLNIMQSTIKLGLQNIEVDIKYDHFNKCINFSFCDLNIMIAHELQQNLKKYLSIDINQKIDS